MRIHRLNLHTELTVGEPAVPNPQEADRGSSKARSRSQAGLLAEIASLAGEAPPPDVAAWLQESFGPAGLQKGPAQAGHASPALSAPRPAAALGEGQSAGGVEERSNGTSRSPNGRSDRRTDGPAGNRASASLPGIDLRRLADRVYELLEEEMARERRRRL